MAKLTSSPTLRGIKIPWLASGLSFGAKDGIEYGNSKHRPLGEKLRVWKKREQTVQYQKFCDVTKKARDEENN